MAVVWLHADQLFHLGGSGASSYLAVDFFFVLSGFVVSLAYDRRLGAGLSWAGFMRIRAIRLLPMLIIGIGAGGVVLVAREAAYQTGLAPMSLAVTALSLTMLPVGFLFGMGAYPANSPTWSLFFEFAAYAAYPALAARIGPTARATLLVASAFALVTVVAWNGTVDQLGYRDPLSFVAGFVRVAFPFAIGAAIHRARWFTRVGHIPFWAVAALLAAVFAQPVQPVWLADAMCVVFVFPALVCLGVNASAGAATQAFCRIAGRLSYPLYLVHSPVLRALDGAYKITHARLSAPSVAIVGILISLGVAWAALRWCDEPVRRWLTQRGGVPGRLPRMA